MRQIKFRAYHHLKRRFIDIFDINCFWDVLLVWYSDLWEPWTSITNQVTLCQYTWLIDKNWKEIYEWDILKMERINSDFQLIVYYKIEHKTFSWFWFIEWECEIIGNIFENPDLVINKLWF